MIFDVSLYSDKKKKKRRQVNIRAYRQISNGEGRKRQDGETYTDRRAGDAAGVSDCAPPLTPPLPDLNGCARALAGQRAYHRVRFRREGCLREHSRSFAIARSAPRRPGNEECSAAAPLSGHDDDVIL